jgi:hypothetical protein
MSSEDKMVAMKMSGHEDGTPIERTAITNKMSAQEKADMFDKMPMSR